VGRPTPAHATSSGKALLAHLGPSAADRIIDAGLSRFTAATVVDARILRRQLGQVQADGYAMTAGEYETGLNAVAAPVFGATGQAVAALSLSGPAYRLPASQLPETAKAVVAAAARISERMGHLG
jgi:DNA-binding IclR family transcriptional regulator